MGHLRSEESRGVSKVTQPVGAATEMSSLWAFWRTCLASLRQWSLIQPNETLNPEGQASTSQLIEECFEV